MSVDESKPRASRLDNSRISSAEVRWVGDMGGAGELGVVGVSGAVSIGAGAGVEEVVVALPGSIDDVDVIGDIFSTFFASLELVDEPDFDKSS